MDLSEFTANYAHLGDDELLCLWADRSTLVPEASLALDSELQKRGLNKQNAIRVKKRFDALAAREAKGPLGNQVTAAKYERNMRHFVGWEEPKFSSPYGRRDIRTMFASIRHKYRVWKAFRDDTGHWPVLLCDTAAAAEHFPQEAAPHTLVISLFRSDLAMFSFRHSNCRRNVRIVILDPLERTVFIGYVMDVEFVRAL